MTAKQNRDRHVVLAVGDLRELRHPAVHPGEDALHVGDGLFHLPLALILPPVRPRLAELCLHSLQALVEGVPLDLRGAAALRELPPLLALLAEAVLLLCAELLQPLALLSSLLQVGSGGLESGRPLARMLLERLQLGLVRLLRGPEVVPLLRLLEGGCPGLALKPRVFLPLLWGEADAPASDTHRLVLLESGGHRIPVLGQFGNAPLMAPPLFLAGLEVTPPLLKSTRDAVELPSDSDQLRLLVIAGSPHFGKLLLELHALLCERRLRAALLLEPRLRLRRST
mmetsp:Transcript_4511/g.10956  ORF Transcript_4511/g.10956 Transcript_4511/m.10956 type:complete len:283 (+) Transcript_4511:1470-2318(+)